MKVALAVTKKNVSRSVDEVFGRDMARVPPCAFGLSGLTNANIGYISRLLIAAARRVLQKASRRRDG